MEAPSAPGVDWRIGSHLLRSDGTFWHGETFINLTPLQRRLLLCFCRRAGQLIPRDQLATEAWRQSEVSDQSLARAIHGLRRVLDEAGLGGQHIATLYGSGYTFTAPVVSEAAAAASEVPPRPAEPASAAERRAMASDHRIEGRTLARTHNPALIPAALRHLRRALELEPTSPEAATDLCWVLLHQAGWGLVPTVRTAQEVRSLLEQVRRGSVGWADLQVVEAEVVSLLDWHPGAAEALFTQADTPALRRSESTQAWARHLLATGRPQAALEALQPLLHSDTPRGWRLAALAHWHRGDVAAALEQLELQLGIDPFPLPTHLLAALLQAEAGATEAALEHLACARRPCGREADVLDLHPAVAWVLARTDQQPEAQRLLQRAGRSPGQGLPSLWGLAALELGELEEAGRWLQRAVDQRCYQAPFVLHTPVLRRHRALPPVQTFEAAMRLAFR